MSRPTLDQYLMSVAQLASQRTTCIRRGVGCVLANARGHILAVGYNGVAKGMPHCNEAKYVAVYHNDPRVLDLGDVWQFGKTRTVKKLNQAFLGGEGNAQCVGFEEIFPNACKGHDLPPGQDSCEAVHAEQNALLQCRDPWEIDTAYVTLSPCKACLKLLLGTSCKRIVYLELHEAGGEAYQLWAKAGRVWEKLTVEKGGVS